MGMGGNFYPSNKMSQMGEEDGSKSDVKSVDGKKKDVKSVGGKKKVKTPAVK